MATKLRRSLYIGLGGTGMNTLLNTKKLFIETYGEVPPMIGFLGLDADGGTSSESIDSKKGKIKLDKNELESLQVKDPMPIYQRYKSEHFSWFPTENVNALTSLTRGCGQIRSNGRFAITINYQKIKSSVATILDRIQKAEIRDNEKYELLNSGVDVHLIFSLGGGTGCGTFIDMAYLINDLKITNPNITLAGYAVLPDVFESMVPGGPAMTFVKPNAYGALMDLDYLMHINSKGTTHTFDYISNTKEIYGSPFNAVFFIDNKNDNNDIFPHVNQLTEMLSLALITSAGEFSTAGNSAIDNIEKHITAGSMNIGDKNAWASGLGVCEILFDGNQLSEIYSNMAVLRVIQRLLNSCENVNVIVNSWIDSPEVNIREDNGQDNVINYIADKQPRYPLTDISDTQNAQQECETYISNIALPNANEVSQRVNQIINNTKDQFRKLIVKKINDECGIKNTLEIILELQRQILAFKQEMENELLVFNKNLPNIISQVELAVKNLKEADSGFFVALKKGKISEAKDVLISVTMNRAIIEREIIRRNAAITVFTSIQSTLLDEYQKVNYLMQTLKNVNTKINAEINQIQKNSGNQAQTFIIELQAEKSKSIQIDDSEIQLINFAKTINTDSKIYDLCELNSDQVYESIKKYTDHLSGARNWKSKTIDEVIDTMDVESLNTLLKKASNKSKPLFKYNYNGHVAGMELYEAFIVGVSDNKNSRLINEDTFKKLQNGNPTIDFINIGSKDKIIIYRQIAAIPAFALEGVLGYKEKFDAITLINRSCQFDMNIKQKMAREAYSLNPASSLDDTLDFWVLGIIFGFIKNDNGNYLIKNTKLGDALDDYWCLMADKNYRDDAYDFFKKNKSSIREELKTEIEKDSKNKGIEAINLLKSDVKTNYMNAHSQINMEISELKAKGNEQIAELVRKEIEYVNKKL